MQLNYDKVLRRCRPISGVHTQTGIASVGLPADLGYTVHETHVSTYEHTRRSRSTESNDSCTGRRICRHL